MIEEPFHLVLIAYGQLQDHERLMEAQATDARYHLAMMIAQGFNGGAQVVWDERNAWRHSLSHPTSTTDIAPLSRDDHMALALDIARKLDAAGVLGARH